MMRFMQPHSLNTSDGKGASSISRAALLQGLQISALAMILGCNNTTPASETVRQCSPVDLAITAPTLSCRLAPETDSYLATFESWVHPKFPPLVANLIFDDSSRLTRACWSSLDGFQEPSWELRRRLRPLSEAITSVTSGSNCLSDSRVALGSSVQAEFLSTKLAQACATRVAQSPDSISQSVKRRFDACIEAEKQWVLVTSSKSNGSQIFFHDEQNPAMRSSASAAYNRCRKVMLQERDSFIEGFGAAKANEVSGHGFTECMRNHGWAAQ